MIKNQSQRGITLIEILVGTTIFALALSLAGGIFTNMVRYQKKAEVSRSLDQQIRSAFSSMVFDIRNSSGDASAGLAGSSPYYNFWIEKDDRLRVALVSKLYQGGDVAGDLRGGTHNRIYYLGPNQRLMVQDCIKHSNDWFCQTAQSITGPEIKVTQLEFEGRHGIGALFGKADPVTHIFPWLKIKITAEYQDPRHRRELASERIHLETTVIPRDFKFWY